VPRQVRPRLVRPRLVRLCIAGDVPRLVRPRLVRARLVRPGPIRTMLLRLWLVSAKAG
jgi:hypothetical protein